MFGLTGRKRKHNLIRVPTSEQDAATALHALVTSYIGALETEASADWCKCQWITHPDDAEVPKDCCRVCLRKKNVLEHPAQFNMDGSHDFRGVRKRRDDEHPECPVHTREGLILGFFTWAGKRD